MQENSRLTAIRNRSELEKRLERDSDFSRFIGICFGAGSVLQIKGDSTVIFRLRGDRNDASFYHQTVFPLAKRYFANGVKIIDEKRTKLSDGREYTVPVIYSALRSAIRALFRYAAFPLGDKPVSIFPEIISDASKDVKRESLKGIIATLGSIKVEKSKTYRKLEFRNKTIEFLEGLGGCMDDAYGVNLSVTGMRGALSPSDTMRIYENGAFIHPHHLRYF